MGKEKSQNKQKGFTLIELLVVIAVIALIASVVMVSVNQARAKSRDARRKEDLRQVATALEFLASAPANGTSMAPGFYPGGQTCLWVISSNFAYSNTCIGGPLMVFPDCPSSGKTWLRQYLPNICTLKDPQGNEYYYATDGRGEYHLGAMFELPENQTVQFTWDRDQVGGPIVAAGVYEFSIH